MPDSARTYLPAAGHDFFLPLYDSIVKLFGGDAARQALVAQAAIGASDRILDLGCGTGTMDVHIKKQFPHVELVALDPDPKALARARKKAARAALTIQFDQGFGDQLPYAAATFDRALSSFMFHHLPTEEKANTLREVHRVLKPGGEFHLADFEGPEDRKHGFLGRLLLSHAHLKENSAANVIALMKAAGFADAAKVGRSNKFFGGVGYYRAVK
jgi:ubiquinone/menaquinone biosynthesis C-methylase UbiE